MIDLDMKLKRKMLKLKKGYGVLYIESIFDYECKQCNLSITSLTMSNNIVISTDSFLSVMRIIDSLNKFLFEFRIIEW